MAFGEAAAGPNLAVVPLWDLYAQSRTDALPVVGRYEHIFGGKKVHASVLVRAMGKRWRDRRVEQLHVAERQFSCHRERYPNPDYA